MRIIHKVIICFENSKNKNLLTSQTEKSWLMIFDVFDCVIVSSSSKFLLCHDLRIIGHDWTKIPRRTHPFGLPNLLSSQSPLLSPYCYSFS